MRFGIIHETPGLKLRWCDFTEIDEADVLNLIEDCLKKGFRVVFDYSTIKPDYGFITIV
jgi:hypothetical protein